MGTRTCTIGDCARPHYAKGLCNPHYLQHRRNGEVTRAELQIADPVERLRALVVIDEATGCHLWQGKVDKRGYGVISVGNRTMYAHRFAYETFVGPIPEGLHVDHVHERGCRHRHCVNVEHLEPVTPAENTRRGEPARRTHCPAGHPYDDVNTYLRPDRGTRECRACVSARQIERKAS